MPSNFEYYLLEMMESAARNVQLQPVILGDNPAGYVGLLSQELVDYDALESGTMDTASGASLLDNLNHIRFRLGALESGVVPGTITVKEENVIISSGVTVLDFHGASVVNEGGGEVRITVSGGGGTGGAFQRNLSVDLTLQDGECLILKTYLNMGNNDLVMKGDAELVIL